MDDQLLERLRDVESSFEDIEHKLADPDVVNDQSTFAELNRRYAELRPIVADYHALVAATDDAREADELAGVESDPDMVTELKALAVERRGHADELEQRLRVALVPTDPNDAKDVIVEIRAAAGGDEAAIWAGDLVRMYERFAERSAFTWEPMDSSPSDSGGFSKITFSVKGASAFSRFKYEAGVHRVQRVPKTESQGRVHTSTATVAVMPEVDAVEVDLNVNDVKVDVFRSSGPGGQSVNTTDSAVRLTHEPTGLVVTCQDEKSQLQNKEKAFRVLRARLYQQQLEDQMREQADSRRSQIGTGDRSEKIRTYNYKENRVTDHRIGLTIKRLPETLDGSLDEFVDALTANDTARRLAEGE